jgi:hypothetical protein
MRTGPSRVILMRVTWCGPMNTRIRVPHYWQKPRGAPSFSKA